MHRHHLTHSLVATFVAVAVILAPDLRPHPGIVAAVVALAALLVGRSVLTHRRDPARPAAAPPARGTARHA